MTSKLKMTSKVKKTKQPLPKHASYIPEVEHKVNEVVVAKVPTHPASVELIGDTKLTQMVELDTNTMTYKSKRKGNYHMLSVKETLAYNGSKLIRVIVPLSYTTIGSGHDAAAYSTKYELLQSEYIRAFKRKSSKRGL
jgi:hypothetical protein